MAQYLQLLDDESSDSEYEDDFTLAQSFRRRQVRDSSDPFQLEEEQFRNAYRFNQNDVMDIVELIRPHVAPAQRKTAISLEFKVLVFLRFAAQGSYQKSVGNDFLHPVSQPMTSKILHELVPIVEAYLTPNFVQFPTSAPEKATIADRFFTKYNVQGLIGLIDGTHVYIRTPPKNDEVYREALYVNRKGCHSLNVLIIFDCDFNIIYLNGKYPGCTHDAFAWRSSEARRHLVEVYDDPQQRGYYLFGDSGFGNEPFLLTPFTGDGRNPQERAFNRMQKNIRSQGERGNGILKNRWRCLGRARVLYYSPNFCGRIVNAVAFLHNFANARNAPVPEADDDEEDQDDDDPDEGNGDRPEGGGRDWTRLGREARLAFIRNHNLQ